MRNNDRRGAVARGFVLGGAMMLMAANPATSGEIGPTARVRVEFIRETGRVPKLLHLESRTGTLVAIDSTGLSLAEPGRGEPLRLSIGEIEAISVSRGRSPSVGLRRGLGWGLLGGFALAVAVDALQTGGAEPRQGIGALGYVAITAGGMGLGAGIGRGVQGEAWQPYDLRQLWHPDDDRNPEP